MTSAGLLGLVSATELLVPLVISYGIDTGAARGNLDAVLIAVLACAALVLANWWTSAAARKATGHACERTIYRLRTRTAEHALNLPIKYHEGGERRDIVTMMTTDINTVSDFLRDDLLGSATDIVSFAAMVIALICTSSIALLVFGVGFPLLIVGLVFTRKRFAPLYIASRTYVIDFTAGIRECLAHFWALQAFGRQQSSQRSLSQSNEQYCAVRSKIQLVNAMYFPAIDLLGVLAVTATIFLGSKLMMSGDITVGLIVALILYLNRIFSTTQRFAQIYDGYKRTEVSLRRLGEFLRLPSERKQGKNSITPLAISGHISVTGVTMRFPGRLSPALRNVTLRAAAGETVAIVGDTGAGKSTLAKLLLGFHKPTEGMVTIDGMDVTTHADELRRLVGYVPQVPYLFDGTVKDNIAYGCPDADQTDIEKAARCISVNDLIMMFPDGYATATGECGAGLSSGQRQLVSLARMELMNPPVVILDEATAQLDMESEWRYFSAMRSLAENRTVIVIAHHLPAVAWADRVVLLEDGGVSESGTHEELLEFGGKYARLWRNTSQHPAKLAV